MERAASMRTDVLFADSTFFDVFDFKLLKGDPKTALERPKSIILSEELCQKVFWKQRSYGAKNEC